MSGLVTFVLGVLIGAVAVAVLRRVEHDRERPAVGTVEAEIPTEPATPDGTVTPDPRSEARRPESPAASDPSSLPVVGPDERRWRPPYVSGQSLLDWARSVSRGIVRDATLHGADGTTAAEIAEGLAPALGQAMLPDVDGAERLRPMPCPAVGQGVIGLTPPEAIALADWLRDRLSPDELEVLEADVTLCEEWIANGASGSPCALQGDDHVCVAYEAQPFACRPTLATTLALRLREDSGAPLGARDSGDTHVETVSRGIREGLRTGLERAGLDARTYELHSALRRALRTPDAAEAWARGEDVFAGCRQAGT